MPFDLILSRATGPIARDELHDVMQGAPAVRKSDTVYWVSHQDRSPWFVVERRDDGRVVLSTSYTNPRFLRNFPDMFDLGLRLAQALGARLIEEVHSTVVTPRNIDSLLAPNGRYVELQAATWRHAVEQMAMSGQAPLELPLGQVDLVGEYLVFHVVPERRDHDATALTDTAVTALVTGADRGIDVRTEGTGTWLAVDAADKQWLTRVLRRDDGAWQVWPAWGMAPFARIATLTTAIAEALAAAAGGAFLFLGLPYDDALRAEVHARKAGLGVDFYLWTQTLAVER
jgi:hypothetical protein